jgi:hypothetical protein
MRRVAPIFVLVVLVALGSVGVTAATGVRQQSGDDLLNQIRHSSSRGAVKPSMPAVKQKKSRHGPVKASKPAKRLGSAKKRSAPHARSATQLNWDGWTSPLMAPVGAIWINRGTGWGQSCSGTVVTRTLVVTAGHCVSHDGVYEKQIAFIPGQTWNDPNTLNVNDVSGNYGGAWLASNWWTPDSYLRGQGGPDWGLIEIPPQNGKYITDYVGGAWGITVNVDVPVGARMYVVGYPRRGFWSYAPGRVGRGQYACDTTWDGDKATPGNTTGLEVRTRCPMNGGASGGPWFVQQRNGAWTIAGVSNWCAPPDRVNQDRYGSIYCAPTSDSIRTLWFDNRFLEFWNSVIPLLKYK